MNRIRLYKRDERMVLKTFKDALETIEPMKADMGRLSDIWYVECYIFFLGLSMADFIVTREITRFAIKSYLKELK